MKFSLAIALDGVVRTLRTLAHGLAEDIENGMRQEVRSEPGRTGSNARPQSAAKEGGDEHGFD